MKLTRNFVNLQYHCHVAHYKQSHKLWCFYWNMVCSIFSNNLSFHKLFSYGHHHQFESDTSSILKAHVENVVLKAEKMAAYCYYYYNV